MRALTFSYFFTVRGGAVAENNDGKQNPKTCLKHYFASCQKGMRMEGSGLK